MSTDGADWRRFMKKHWRAVALFGLGGALAIAWAVYVFVWFVSNAQSSGLVPSMLGLWTIGNLVTFLIDAVLWELLLVGVPVAVAVGVAWQWIKKLPGEEWKGYRLHGRKRTTGGGGGSLLFFIAFCIKVYVDGKWNVPIATFTLDYVVGSAILILVLAAIIFGVPAAIALTWWLSRETKKP